MSDGRKIEVYVPSKDLNVHMRRSLGLHNFGKVND